MRVYFCPVYEGPVMSTHQSGYSLTHRLGMGGLHLHYNIMVVRLKQCPHLDSIIIMENLIKFQYWEVTFRCYPVTCLKLLQNLKKKHKMWTKKSMADAFSRDPLYIIRLHLIFSKQLLIRSLRSFHKNLLSNILLCK